jgi:hypothetical protein
MKTIDRQAVFHYNPPGSAQKWWKNASQKMKLEDFPNIYTGEKNCFDCEYFRIRLKVDPRTSEILFKEKNYARCTKGFILRDGKDKREAAKPTEPTYPICPTIWGRIKNGWRHFEWGVANVCEDFESMVDDAPATE